ncbi:protein YgfX [Chitinimonas koreensis]|uniref:protein YgfX n=1 Tax=Chitinimonas koreensis TaxID=356302 RepID=UPI000412205A|nr:protein YgfX [Chitinimonas koreensis]QNM95585.1 hypothetical protein H9L41_17215 [Chitinimonas koreensis]
MKSIPSLRLLLRPSRLERRGAALLHLAALPMPWLAALPLPARIGITLVLLASWALCIRRWRREPALTLLRLLPDGGWGLSSGGDEIEAALRLPVYSTRWLIVLPLQGTDGSRRRLLLWPDSAGADELRRLRAWLRWGAANDGGTADDAGTSEQVGGARQAGN